MIASDSDASTETFSRVFKPTNIIALPAVQRNRNRGELRHGDLRIDTKIRVTGFR